ncbi:Zwei Ig domain protein zig-8 [Lucilia cuprina]|nr:Zwei Ig domain protein zig-8 [Lucilia cuprina]
MTFEYFNNFFNTTASATKNIQTTCPTTANICNSNNNNSSSSKNSSSSQKSATFNSSSKNSAAKTTNTSTRLYPTALRRKIRKTSRRKRKRRRSGCLHNKNSSNFVNMVDNITASAVVARTNKITTSYKCKLSVNNKRTTTKGKLQSYINKHNKNNKYNNKPRYFISKCCLHIWKSIRSNCHITKSSGSCCSSNSWRFSRCSRNCYNCSCSRKKISLIVKNIVTLLLSQTTQIKTTAKLAHATTTTAVASSNRKYVTNNVYKRKKVQLHLKQQKKLQQWQLKYLYALGKCVIKTTTTRQKQKQEHVQATEQTQITTKLLLNSSNTTTRTALSTSSSEATKITSTTSTTTSSTSPSYVKTTRNTFSTLLQPKCKILKTNANSSSLTHSYSCSTSSSASPFSTWYRFTCPAPAFRIFNELYGVIFMTLLVLSICHNNAYKSAKGAGRIEAPFEEQMDAIFRDRPICTNTKTITLNGQKTHALKEKINKEIEITEEAAVDEENTDNQKLPKKRQKIRNFQIEKIDILWEYLDKKIELKKIAEEGRERRHQEKLKMLILETSAASVSRRDVVASSIGEAETVADVVKQVIMPSSADGRLNGRQYKRQHPPEQISEQQLQQLPQAYNHHQPQSYLSREVEQEPLENEMEEDKSNHIFQPQIQTESLPVYQQHERDQQLQLYHQQQRQQQQQHSTTQPTSFSHGMALETTYNHTFQSLSIIDGDLTVAVDTSQNLMAVEEEMLVAAAGGAVGVGSSAFSLGNHLHLHNSNNVLGSYDSTAMGLDGIDVMTHNTETNSMPIFDFGMPRNITARTGHTEAIIKCRVDRLDDKSVSWIRKRDLHILTVGTATYTSDKRFQVTESKDSREWTLHVKSPQARDSGIYECQVNTEPKISMAFQLNVIEISPDAKAVITGPADLHFKVGSAIILTCIVHQPSVKDIGPIYWYRGEYMITPFDINDNTHEELAFPMSGVTTPTVMGQNKVNVVEQNLLQQRQQLHDGIYGGGGGGAAAVGVTDSEQIPQILTNEIAQDFAQRIAMESQLGDTMKSRLRISNAQTSDTGNYTCQPTTASSASVMVHVINDENPAAMQKSGASSIHYKHSKTLFVCATIVVAAASILNIICGHKRAGSGSGGSEKIVCDEDGYCRCCYWLSSTTSVIRRKSCIMFTCLCCHVISTNMLEGIIDLIRLQLLRLELHNNLPPWNIHIHIATYNIQLMQSDVYYLVVYRANVVFVAIVVDDVVVCINCTSSASDIITFRVVATCTSSKTFMSITGTDSDGGDVAASVSGCSVVSGYSLRHIIKVSRGC